jgi:hypothetical protein
MSLINRLLQRMTGQSRLYRTRRRQPFSPFGIQAAQVETLETRRLLSALTVTTAADSGAGSLRAEIAAAHSGDSINFASSLQGQTITLTSGELLINKGLTIQGPGAAQLTISGGNASRVFDVASSQPVMLTGLTISNGHTIYFQGGGGIFNAGGSNLTVSGCTISNSRAGNGGGIYNDFRGTLTLSACNISGDSTFSPSYTTPFHADGGGIFNAGTLTATNCTLSGDVAGSNGGGIYDIGKLTAGGCTLSGDSATGTIVYGLSGRLPSGIGGGIYVYGGSLLLPNGYYDHGQASLTNCTIAGNFANGNPRGAVPSGSGGGLYVDGSSSNPFPDYNVYVYLINCTVSLNRANSVGGGIAVEIGASGYGGGPALRLVNTIVAGNTDRVNGGSVYSEGFYGADIQPGYLDADHCLLGNGSGVSFYATRNGNIVGGLGGNPVINAMLGPLQNNGGPTMTMALLVGSPAIGHGVSASFGNGGWLNAPATDQRGVTRQDVAGELIDIGAYEL